MNIVSIIFETVERHPNKVAIKDEFGELSYRELQKQIITTSDILKSQGIKKGMGVGVMDRNSRQFIICLLAVLHAEAVAMPISNQLKTNELKKILSESQLHILLDAQNGADLNLELKDKFKIDGVPWLIKSAHSFNVSMPFANHVIDPAIVRFTSGTTGKAKGVIIGHQSIIERIDAANKKLQLGVNDTVVWVLPMAYHFVVSIILYLRNACTIALCDQFMGENIYKTIVKHQGNFLYASPMHIKMLCNLSNIEKLTSLRKVISTSTAISRELCIDFANKYGLPVTQAYGIIEIGLPIINENIMDQSADAVGFALADYMVGILSDEMTELARGEIGHLAIKGPGMFDAYLKPALQRKEVLRDDWFMTGDLASKAKNGLIRVEGRQKSMINVSGNKVFPIEVETILNSHKSVKLSKVSAFKHRLLGEVVMASIVLEDKQVIDKEKLISFCRERLSTFKIPQKIKIVDSLEMTDSGKLKR